MASDDQNFVPTWNGDPSKFEDWKQRFRIWTHTCELRKKTSYASMVANRLTSTALKCALELFDGQLFPFDGDKREGAGWEKKE